MFTLSLINPATNTPFYTKYTNEAVWSTTRFGEERLRAVISNISLSDAVNLFDKAALAYVKISANAERVWSGVVTDVQLAYSNNSYSLIVNAVGYSFLLKNNHVTALFSKVASDNFYQVRSTELSQAVYDNRVKIEFKDSSIWIIVAANSVFTSNESIYVAYTCPNKAIKKIKYAQVRYLNPLPNFNFSIYFANNTPFNSPWSVSFAIPNVSPNTIHTFSLSQEYSTVVFVLKATSNFVVPSQITARFDYIHVYSIPRPITASKIMKERNLLVINKVAQETELLDVVVEDVTDFELFNTICKQDNLEYEMLDYNVVELRRHSELANRVKYRIVAETFNISRDATTIANNVYARYKEVRNRKIRTERADDAVARDVYANSIFRDAYIDVDTYSETVATAKRNEALVAMRSGSMRLLATTRNVATLSQNPVPAWKVRAGTVAGIVNLGQIGYGQVSEVIIDRTDYDAATDTLTIESQLDSL